MDKTISKNSSKSSKEKSITIPLAHKYIMSFAITIFGFFIGRVSIFQSINPIAVSFLSLFSFSGKIFYAISVSVSFGLLTISDSIHLTRYLICIIIMNLINLSLRGLSEKNQNIILIRSSIGSASILISGLIIAFLNSFSLYYTVLAFLEAILSFSLSFILKKSIDLLYHNQYQNVIDNEELLSLSILIGAIVAGSANIYIGSMSIMYLFASLSLMIISYKNGAGLGSGAAVILTSVLIISENMPQEALAIFSIASTCLGLAKKAGRLVSVFCFIISGIITSLYLNQLFLTMELFISVGAACIMFIAIPDKYYFSLTSSSLAPSYTSKAYSLRIKDITSQRLKGFSGAFERLSKTFQSLSEKRVSLSKAEVTKLIDDVAERTCSNCNMNIFCWENNFYNTYQTFFSILASCEGKGYIEEDDIPKEFLKNCINADVFVETTNRLFEIYKVNLYWRNKIAESRQLIGNQFMEISKIINSLSIEIEDEIKNCDDLSQKLTEVFFKKNYEADSIAVIETKDKKTEVIINHPSCYNRNLCLKEIIPTVNEALGKEMFKSNCGCKIETKENKSICKLKLCEEYQFSINVGISRKVKEGSTESGDSYTFINLQNGYYLLALSDGMGSGEKAKEQSGASIELFEEFMEAGFDKNTAINIINSVLVLKSEPDIFSTLDICMINLYTGMCEFAKIGAASTFIIKNNKIEIIKSTSLPVGMLSSVDIETDNRILSDLDMIVMVTDGITDSIETIKRDDWIADFLKDCKIKEPQIIADKLIEKAKHNSEGKIFDDMTVLAAKLKSR